MTLCTNVKKLLKFSPHTLRHKYVVTFHFNQDLFPIPALNLVLGLSHLACCVQYVHDSYLIIHHCVMPVRRLQRWVVLPDEATRQEPNYQGCNTACVQYIVVTYRKKSIGPPQLSLN